MLAQIDLISFHLQSFCNTNMMQPEGKKKRDDDAMAGSREAISNYRLTISQSETTSKSNNSLASVSGGPATSLFSSSGSWAASLRHSPLQNGALGSSEDLLDLVDLSEFAQKNSSTMTFPEKVCFVAGCLRLKALLD